MIIFRMNIGALLRALLAAFGQKQSLASDFRDLKRRGDDGNITYVRRTSALKH